MFEQVSLEVGGRSLTFETGKMARQAHGAVVARYGDTVILATACMDSKAAEKDFLPLTVDYREYTSAALYISKIPFTTPIAAVRVGMLEGKLVVNPTVAEQKTSTMNIVVAGSDKAIVMVESGALEVSEDAVADALEFAHAEIRKIVAAIRELHDKVKTQKVTFTPPAFDEALYKQLLQQYGEKLRDASDTAKYPKSESYSRIDAIKSEIYATIPAEDVEKKKLAARAFERLREFIFRDDMLTRKRRPDARAFDQVREITCETGVLPRAHGSALFTRGETQSLSTATLGTKEDMQRQDLLFEKDTFKHFMLHYNFPPFSVGEVKFLRGPGRREIGHGALAERALANLMPSDADFPYAVRCVSDILESNDSSSMATVCGGSLALMDAGVPIKSPCAGIAMGLVVGDNNKYSILTDIAGAEDHYGDMDFKVAGTRAGITALQMDIKVLNVTIPMMREALAQAKKARIEILDIMEKTLSTHNAQISAYAPRLYKLQIPTDKIRDLIGPGGKKIKSY